MTAEFGAGFDVSNLRKMRNFYELFRKQDALRPELTWTHYRLLLKVKDENARNWYIEELQMELDRNRRFLLENKRN